jgi:phosphoenolpyruvate carboxylase
MKRKVKTASCGCIVRKVHASYRRQGWKCEWEKQGKMCESLAEVWVKLQDDTTREGQVYCHTHLMAHTVVCAHPTEHVTKVTEPTVPVIQPTNHVPEWLTRLRAMSLQEIIEFQRKLGEL